MSNYRVAPTYEQPTHVEEQTSSVWYRFFQALHLGTPPAAEQPVIPSSSPFTYRASQGGYMIVSGGTVSAIKVTRTTATATGQTSGLFPLSQGDALTVTYSSAPTMTWVPQ